ANVMPAGRLAAETTRAALLARSIGVGPGAAVGLSHQALSLLASGLVLVPCTFAAARIPVPLPTTVMTALRVQTIVLVVSGAGILVAVRAVARTSQWLLRNAHRFGS